MMLLWKAVYHSVMISFCCCLSIVVGVLSKECRGNAEAIVTMVQPAIFTHLRPWNILFYSNFPMNQIIQMLKLWRERYHLISIGNPVVVHWVPYMIVSVLFFKFMKVNVKIFSLFVKYIIWLIFLFFLLEMLFLIKLSILEILHNIGYHVPCTITVDSP